MKQNTHGLVFVAACGCLDIAGMLVINRFVAWAFHDTYDSLPIWFSSDWKVFLFVSLFGVMFASFPLAVIIARRGRLIFVLTQCLS